tara:strand:+ start:931 stop:1098 length:168 start_codon:yes stop_codon:yes gene_type:complete
MKYTDADDLLSLKKTLSIKLKIKVRGMVINLKIGVMKPGIILHNPKRRIDAGPDI